MKRLHDYWAIALCSIACLLLLCNAVIADDTCIFAVTADDVPPNIVLLLDNGAVVASGTPAEVLTPEVLAPVYGVELMTLIAEGEPRRRWIVPTGHVPERR